MDQAESSPSPGQPDPQGRPSRTPPPEVAAETGAKVPGPAPHAEPQSSALRLEHPVIAGYDGSASSRNALAYAAGVSQRLGRPLLVVYVCSSGVYCGRARDRSAEAYLASRRGLCLRLASPPRPLPRHSRPVEADRRPASSKSERVWARRALNPHVLSDTRT